MIIQENVNIMLSLPLLTCADAVSFVIWNLLVRTILKVYKRKFSTTAKMAKKNFYIGTVHMPSWSNTSYKYSQKNLYLLCW